MVVVINFLPHVFVGDITHFRHVARLVSASHLPYRSVFWEFPPLTVPFLILEKLSFGSRAAYLSLFAAVTISLELASLELLRRAWPDRARDLTRIWSATVLPVAALAYFRLDFLAVLFATVALIRIERRQTTAGPIVAGVATKLWPGLLLAVLAAQRRWREVAVGLAGCAAVFGAWYAFSPSGFRAFLRYRAGQGLEIESVPASLRLLGHHGRFVVRSGAWVIDAGGFRWVDPVTAVGLVAFMVVLGGWAYRRRESTPSRSAVRWSSPRCCFPRLLSAQYLVWLAPFVAVLWIRERRAVGWVSMAASWLTVVELLWFEHELIRGSKAIGAVVLARNLALVVLLVLLVAASAAKRESAGQQQVMISHRSVHELKPPPNAP